MRSRLFREKPLSLMPRKEKRFTQVHKNIGKVAEWLNAVPIISGKTVVPNAPERKRFTQVHKNIGKVAEWLNAVPIISGKTVVPNAPERKRFTQVHKNIGKVAEWLNAAVSKTVVRNFRTGGSNPPLSAQSFIHLKAYYLIKKI